MDVKDIFKFQMMNQMGATALGGLQNGSQQNLLQIFMNLVIMLWMSMLDDITKSIPGLMLDLKKTITFYCRVKVQKTMEEVRPKMISDYAVNLTTRHNINTFTMTRVYEKSENKNSSSDDNSEESNGMMNSVIAHLAKLDNIPSFVLAQNGNVMVNYLEKPIQITKDIFVKIEQVNVSPETSKIGSIQMSLISNSLSASEITNYVKNLYENYLQELKNSLGNNIYFFDQKTRDSSIPSLPPIGGSHNDQNAHKRMLISTAPKQLSFTMTNFYSNKKFSNIYGVEARLVEKRLKFFLERRDWYDDKGIPYQLGILLSGLPGAGKTSIIRAIANLTKRHIINVNFANITTATQLKNLFYS